MEGIDTLACHRAPGPFLIPFRPHPLSDPTPTGPDPAQAPAEASVASIAPSGRPAAPRPAALRPGGWRWLLAQLTVRGNPDQPATNQWRLSAFGHTALTSSIFLAGILGFMASSALTQKTMHRWDLCGHTEDILQTQSHSHSRFQDMTSSDGEAQAAIARLSAATPSQRSRLLEQRQEIIDIMGSYCLISHNFQIQFTAFTVIGTAAGILVTISLASVAPDGLRSKNRTLLNVLMSAGIVLAICVIYPQAFSQSSNLAEAKSIYMQAANLHRSFSSAIANQQASTNNQNPPLFSPLNSSDNVAIFIRSNDNALDQLTASRLSMNNDFANRTLNQLTPASSGGAAANSPSPNPSGPTP